VTDLDCARLTQALYTEEAAGYPSFTHADCSGSVCWGIKTLDDVTVLVFRGSVDRQDWFLDFLALSWREAAPYKALGPVHLGFSTGLVDAWTLIKPRVIAAGKPLIIAGHSLGAARAWIVAGMAIIDGIVPARIVVFGSPRPGFAKLASVVAEVPQKSYRNGHDHVCSVPFYEPPEFLYVQPAPFTPLNAKLSPGHTLGVFAEHHISLYVAGLEATERSV
jgi:hypothetical protein